MLVLLEIVLVAGLLRTSDFFIPKFDKQMGYFESQNAMRYGLFPALHSVRVTEMPTPHTAEQPGICRLLKNISDFVNAVLYNMSITGIILDGIPL